MKHTPRFKCSVSSRHDPLRRRWEHHITWEDSKKYHEVEDVEVLLSIFGKFSNAKVATVIYDGLRCDVVTIFTVNIVGKAPEIERIEVRRGLATIKLRDKEEIELDVRQ